jgi:pimeloyl-ACP methyl ester carboxylesterase
VLPGFVEMVLDPHFARPPEAIVEAFRRWLVERFGADGAHNAVSAPGSLSGRVARGVDERADFLDRERRLFGIVSAPAERTPPNRAVIILNAGANHRTGAGRVSVKVARRLAARGWLVLRFDLSGLGDSLPRRGSPENEVYTPDAVPDLATALDFLNTRYHLDRSEAVGLCSGAYHAFKAAAAGLPLTGVVVVNPLVFFWKRGMSLAYPPYQVLESSARYRRSLFQGAKWRALLRGEKDMQIMGGVVARRLGHQLLVIMREVARALHVPLKKDLARELADIDRNGIALRFLFSTGDPGEALLRDSAGSRLGWLRRRGALRVDRLNGCDHSLSSAWMHEAFYTRLLEYFDARDVRPVARRMPGNVGATARTTEPVASDV